MAGSAESDRLDRARVGLAADPTLVLSDEQLAAVIDRTKNVDVAVDAIRMNPRPGWLAEMIGPIEES